MYVPADQVLSAAEQLGGHSFDVPGARYTHQPSPDGWWVYRAPGTSKECPPSCSAADRTWSAGTYMISASGSINRRISHGQAIRSVLGRARVTHFMVSPWHWVG